MQERNDSGQRLREKLAEALVGFLILSGLVASAGFWAAPWHL